MTWLCGFQTSSFTRVCNIQADGLVSYLNHILSQVSKDPVNVLYLQWKQLYRNRSGSDNGSDHHRVCMDWEWSSLFIVLEALIKSKKNYLSAKIAAQESTEIDDEDVGAACARVNQEQ